MSMLHLWRPYRVPPAARDDAVYATGEPDHNIVPILVARDYSRLKAMAHLWVHSDDPVSRALAYKLSVCRVVSLAAVPSTVAVLDAPILFMVKGRAPEFCILVMPDDHREGGPTMSVSTPIGAALLGAIAGQQLEGVERDGRHFTLSLLTVSRYPGRPCAVTTLAHLIHGMAGIRWRVQCKSLI